MKIYPSIMVGLLILISASIVNAQVNSANGAFNASNAASDLSLQTQGVTKVTVSSSGNVGIGVTTPQAKLDINGAGAPGLLISGNDGNFTGSDINISRLNTTADVGRGATLRFNDVASKTYSLIQNSSGGLQFFNYYNSGSWVERMRILPNGNVGIGTSSPVGKLNVYDQGKASTVIIGNVNAGFSFINIGTSAEQNGYSYIESVKSSGTTYGDLVMNHNGGNVGIGITSPLAKLHVSNGSVLVSDANFNTINARLDGTGVPALRFTRYTGVGTNHNNAFVGQFYNTALLEYSLGFGTGITTTGDQNANSTVMAITLGGNVGIGTTSPKAKLDVGNFLDGGNLGTVLGRLSEGNSTGNGTFLGVRGYNTTPANSKSFAIEHNFYGMVNSSINFNRGGGMQGGFITFNTEDNTERMRITPSGSVGIGTIDPKSFKLAVNGKVWATEVQVALTVPGPDYVFEKDYDLPTLEDVKTYIDTNKHLPEVPSACEMEENGINLSEMNLLLLKKVEELTLYLLKQEKTIAEQNERLLKLETMKQ